MSEFLLGKQAMINTMIEMANSGCTDEQICKQAVALLRDRGDLKKVANFASEKFALGVSSACSDYMSSMSEYAAGDHVSQDPVERAEDILKILSDTFQTKVASHQKRSGFSLEYVKENPGKSLGAAGLVGAMGLGGLGAGALAGTGLAGAGIAGALLARKAYQGMKGKEEKRSEASLKGAETKDALSDIYFGNTRSVPI